MNTHSSSLFWRFPLGSLLVFELLAILQVFPVQPVYTNFGLFITNAGILAFIEVIHYKFKQKKHAIHWWAVTPVVIDIYLDALGEYLHFYTTIEHYDTFLHFLGSAIAAFFLWYILYHFTERSSKYTSLVLFGTAILTISLGLLYELEEFTEDMMTGSNRLGGSADTLLDVSMDMMGIGTFLLIMKMRQQWVSHSSLHQVNE